MGHDHLLCYQGFCQTYLAFDSSLPVSPHENCQLSTVDSGVAPRVIAAKSRLPKKESKEMVL
jgi:hypothetical protein